MTKDDETTEEKKIKKRILLKIKICNKKFEMKIKKNHFEN